MDPDNFQTLLTSDFNFSNLLTKQLDKKAASSILNITCQRNLTPLHGTHKVKWEILGRKKSMNMCQNAFFPCLQEIRMLRSKREEQKTDV